MCSVTLNFADWLEAIFWRSFWHIFWHSFWQIFWYIFWHSFWHIFWHSFWHLSDISFDILSDKSFDTLSDISSDILSDISFDMLSDISSDILSDISKPNTNIHSFTKKAALQTLYEFWFLFLHILNGRMATLPQALPRSFRDLNVCFRESKFKIAASASFRGVDIFTIFLEVLPRSHRELPRKLFVGRRGWVEVCYLNLLVGRAFWQCFWLYWLESLKHIHK